MRKTSKQRVRGRRPPLDEDLILSWADEHFALFGAWPNQYSGDVAGHDSESWHNISTALRIGSRGLLLGSSLAILLEERRGVVNRLNKPDFTVEGVLVWADVHHAKHGRYPKSTDGPIEASPTDTWCGVDNAFRQGVRGCPGGSSLARILQERRNYRNERRLPKLCCEAILEWADEHCLRTGQWPGSKSGAICAAPGETWAAVQMALVAGIRGMPGGSSLAQFLLDHRGKKVGRDLPPYSVETITQWMRAHAERHGRYPVIASGTIEEAPGENWQKVQNALFRGHRGLEGGSSLLRLRLRLISEGLLPELGRTSAPGGRVR